MSTDNTTPHNSAVYDQNIRKVIPYHETIHLETVDLVKTVKPDVHCWLDTGCGTGSLVAIAVPHFPRTQFVLADPSDGILQQAKVRLMGFPETRVKFLPPISSEKLLSCEPAIHPQVVTAILCHHYLQPAQRREAVKACYEILDKEGLFVSFENIDRNTVHGVQIGLARWKGFQVEHGRSEEETLVHLERFKTEYFPITIGDHLDLLASVGFQEVELFWHSHMQAGFYAIK